MYTSIKERSLLWIAFGAVLIALFMLLPHTAHADYCSELSKSAGGYFSCTDQGATTFTQFSGGLKAPSTEGYDPSLTQQTNLRDFVINAVNFILGFLGLLAVIIVIYGGFMYLTAMGNEEKTGKGKKSIMYAMIGIVIILISFALVNTVIKGIGRGTDSGTDAVTLSGSATEQELSGDQTAAVQRLFYMAATQVEKAAKDIATSYSHYVDVNDLLTDLQLIPTIRTQEQLHIYLGDIDRSMGNLISMSGELSRVAQAAKAAQNHFKLILMDSRDLSSEEWLSWWDVEGYPSVEEDVDYYFTSAGSETESILRANEIDFGQNIQKTIDDLEKLRKDVEASGLVATAETEFGTVYQRAKSALESLKPTGFAPPTTTKVVDALEALGEVHTVVSNIQFVAAIIATDVSSGNAPLIVNMDALNSRRPDYQSIQEGDIIWDFGDGTKTEGKFATSHVYRKTGSYIIGLEIKGDSLKNIASGKAYKEIKVSPPASQINLKASVGGRDLGYLSYYKDGFLVIDKNRLNLTLTEARDEGVTFDASESRGGYQEQQAQQGGETYIQSITWTFGDGGDPVSGEMVAEDVQTHYYGQPGTYSVIVQVTDSRGISDRKVFEVVVDSPAARIDVSPSTTTKINNEVTFDAGRSTSDGGQITGYSWDIQNTSLKYSAEETTESFRKTFDNPGVYNVSLAVTDNLGKQALDSVQLVVESEPPQAQITINQPDTSKPHVYMLDGTQSFDSDGDIQKGNYTYKWTLTGVDEDYDFVDEIGNADPEGYTKNRTYVKFFRTGNYKVMLEVNDPNEPSNPGKPATKDINVTSILDVAFVQEDQPAVSIDENGEAKITLSAVSENGMAYEWDFGDNTTLVKGDIISGKTTASHTYDKAGSYDVRLTVFDRQNNENTIKRRVVVGESDMPISVISLKVNGVEIYDFTDPIVVNRKAVLAFSAEKALNRDGTGRRLGYQWDFGNTKRSTDRDATYTYPDLSPEDPGYYVVTLKVLDRNDLTKTAETTINVQVIGELPTMQAFTAVPQQSELVTPVRVKLEALGATDPDGKIVKYLWWYYNEKDPQMTMGHTITQVPQAVLTIGTRGITNEEIAYKFGLEMTDQENFTVRASEILSENLIPTVTVVNGQNDEPVARFTVDRTSIMVGESITFTSSSVDPDGSIVQYIWDFEGDGFSDNKATTQSTIINTFNTPAVKGLNVRLKVVDDKFAESVSLPLKIFVDAEAADPMADFDYESPAPKTVKFTNLAKADEAAGAELVSYKWDFDVSKDTDLDGIRDNDIDSEAKDPQYLYAIEGVYRAKLTVEDNFGKINSIIKFVNAKPESAFSADGQVNILGAINQNNITTMVVSLVLFAIVALSLYMHSIRLENHKK
ncbi:PKD domain-containing protein [Candidatus Peregrinibacteria bacterium]|nr:PKD domain-containing protein [Candidatus Peregrinibacteria bacterium]